TGGGGMICGNPTATTECQLCMNAGGSCVNGVCTFACGTACNPCPGDVLCPKGMPCSVDCPAFGCTGKIDCKDATTCTIRCGDNACTGAITCGARPRHVTAAGGGRCRRGVDV